ncbi:hypothetical protein E3P81_02909 [Wallemia ichthyophaga]|nr:hypothetical protein E3P97_03019 [Wallemia ichthyophaga]TIB30498.1 hypothetical protein E3P85_02713 [Wallemia ichthyophaga]TIB45315.1 hypothetical protein E3P82_02910 [Wallemia ichthyophaga]TIB48389.1 hypothetical protein E3P81_02909 [Wallemia ichthyophaga]TIB51700.1 hypothetical protein E3P80_02950 [Wallemia ichthyophaga]
MKDGERFIQPGCLNILVVPIKPIRKSVYKSSLEALSSFQQMKGSEVPGFSAFHPPPLSPTSHTIHINYHSNPNSIINDAQVAFSDQFHAVVGVVDCPSHSSLDTANDAFNHTIVGLPASLKPPIQRCWAFQPRDSERAANNPSSHLALVEDSAFYLNTLIADIIGSILSWFAETAGERRKNDGRQSKLYGDLFLMSGRLKESLASYNESLSQLRAPVDSFHHASAIECQAVAQVLLYWQKTEKIPIHALLETPWAAIYDKFSSALASYKRLLQTSSSSAPASNSSLNINNLSVSNTNLTAVRTYVRACLRFSKFLLTVWACGGLNDESLNALVIGGSPVFLETQPDRDMIVEHADKMPHLPRSQISLIAEMAHGAHLLQLDRLEQLKVTIALLYTHDSIGYARKAAYFRQEVVAICTDLLEASRNDLKTEESYPKVVLRQLKDNSESLVKILDDVCDVYGIDTQFRYLYRDEDNEARDSFKEELEHSFNWTTMQRNFLRDAISIVEHIGDFNAIIKYSAILLRYFYFALAAPEQVRIVQIMLAALDVLRRSLTTTVELAFWVPDPLLSLELITWVYRRIARFHLTSPRLPGNAIPFAYSSQRSSIRKLANTPARRSLRIAEAMTVQNEMLEIAATLHNPYKFPLELQGVELIMRMKGTVTKEIILPLSNTDEEKRKSKARSLKLERRSKMKSSALNSTPSLQRQSMSSRSSTIASMNDSRRTTLTSAPGGMKSPQYINITAIHSLPTLVVAATNMNHHALMLYSGECTTLKLILENTSDVDVDFIDIKFSDNSTECLLSAIEEQQGSLTETHEMEYTVAHEPVFRPCTDISAITIPARRRAVLDIYCYGRVGCNQGSIIVEYGRDSEDSEQIYARQLVYSLSLTVQQTLEAQQISVLPFEGVEKASELEQKDYFGLWPNSPSASASQPMTPTQMTQPSTPHLPLIEQSQLLQNSNKDTKEFLLIVDIRNSFGTPFEVVLERVKEDEEEEYMTEFGVCRLVQPGSTARLVLPVRRMKLREATSTANIPSLCERQFTVSQTSLPLKKERIMREIFWYSQELYKNVRLFWREPDSTTDTPRAGNLNFNLRKHKLSRRMLEMVKLNDIDIDLAQSSWDKIVIGKEAQLRLRIANKSERFMKLKYKVQASVEGCVIIKGPEWTHLQRLESDEETVQHVRILPLSKCRVEVVVILEEVYADDIVDATIDWDERVRRSVERIQDYKSKPCIIDMTDNVEPSQSWDVIRQALKERIQENIKKYYDNTSHNTQHDDLKNTREMDKPKVELDTRTRTEPEINIADGGNNLQLGQSDEHSQSPDKSRVQTPAVVIGPKRAPVVESVSEKEAFEEFNSIWQIIEVDFVDEPPFTIQRISELAIYNDNKDRGSYRTVGKYLRALHRVVMVTSGKISLDAQIKAMEGTSNTNTCGLLNGEGAVPLDSVELSNASALNVSPSHSSRASAPPTPMFSPIPFLANRKTSREISPLSMQDTQADVEDFGNVNLNRPTSPTSSSSNAAAAAAAALSGGTNSADGESDAQPPPQPTTAQEHLGIVDELDAGQGKVAEEPVSLSSTTQLESGNGSSNTNNTSDNSDSDDKNAANAANEANEEEGRANKRRKSEHLIENEDEKLKKSF